MRNLLFLTTLVALCVSAVGCAGPLGCRLAGDNCYDCAGGYVSERPLATGPIDALRQARRSLVCGGGCGEVYYGEWISSPPDCQDPCHGSEFVGGAVPGRPFCWQPGTLIGGLYGSRFQGGGDCGCSTCDSGEHLSYDEGYESVTIPTSSSAVMHSCPTCSASHHQQSSPSMTSTVSRPPVDSATTARTATRTSGGPNRSATGTQMR
jgi:hypothetical protein